MKISTWQLLKAFLQLFHLYKFATGWKSCYSQNNAFCFIILTHFDALPIYYRFKRLTPTHDQKHYFALFCFENIFAHGYLHVCVEYKVGGGESERKVVLGQLVGLRIVGGLVAGEPALVADDAGQADRRVGLLIDVHVRVEGQVGVLECRLQLAADVPKQNKTKVNAEKKAPEKKLEISIFFFLIK